MDPMGIVNWVHHSREGLFRTIIETPSSSCLGEFSEMVSALTDPLDETGQNVGPQKKVYRLNIYIYIMYIIYIYTIYILY